MTDSTLIKGKMEELVTDMQEDDWYSNLAPALQLSVAEVHRKHIDSIRISVGNFLGMEKRREPKLSGSNIGSCPREIWLKTHGAIPEKFRPRTKFTFQLGDSFECDIVSLVRIIALLDDTITVREDLLQADIEWNGIKGHCDLPMVINGENYLGECKVRTSYGYRRDSVNGPEDLWGYPHQANFYCRALEQETGEEWDKILWLFGNKDTGHFAELVEERNDGKYVDLALDMIDAVGSDAMPPRPPHGQSLDGDKIKSIKCCYCGVKRACWGELTVTFTSKGKPEYHIKEDGDGELER